MLFFNLIFYTFYKVVHSIGACRLNLVGLDAISTAGNTWCMVARYGMGNNAGRGGEQLVAFGGCEREWVDTNKNGVIKNERKGPDCGYT